jgi:hypothetical protein
MSKPTWLSALGLLVAIAILATGCGAAPTSGTLPQVSTDRGARESLPAAPLVPMATPAPQPTAGGSAAIGDRLVIKTGNISILVKDVQEALSAISNMASSVNGYVVSTKSGREGDTQVATISIKVPAADFEPTMEKLRKMALEPPTESITGQDVTEEYADLDAQLRNLQATEKQLLNLLDRAQTVDDTLKVYNQLTNIRGQIERIQGRMQYLQKSAAMSTITVNLRPQVDKPVVKTGSEAWQPGETTKNALRALLSVLQVLGDLAIWAVIFSPICIVPLIFLWIIWRLTRRRNKEVKRS